MINPLTSLLAQAEFSLTGMARRTVESVTVPLKAKGEEMIAEAREAAFGILKVLVIKIVLAVVAGLMLVVALVYAVGALYQELLPRLGPVEAGLVMALIFAVIAIVALLLMIFWPTGKATTATQPAARVALDARRAVGEAQAGARSTADAAIRGLEADVRAASAPPLAEPSPLAGNLRSSFDTVVDVLGEAGFRREQAGLKAGLALASQLKPMQLVSLALIGGFAAAMRSSPRLRRR